MPDPAPSPVATALEEDIHCPLCNYNLRGLNNPRCPECGFAFTWDELLDQHRRMHPYLFEHHPERNAWSFFKTLRGAQRPRGFWTTLSPVQASRPRRLFAYAFSVNGVFLILLAIGWSASVVAISVLRARSNVREQAITVRMLTAPNAHPNSVQFRNRIIAQYGSIQAYNDRNYPTSVLHFLGDASVWSDSFRRGGSAALGCVAFLSWPWLTYLALMIFRISMRLARIRSIHVLRCVIYNADVALWGALLAVPALAFWRQFPFYSRWSGPTLTQLVVFAIPSFLMVTILFIWTWRLAISYRDYLRFNHPIATIIASQAVVLIAWLNLSLIDVWL